MNKSNIIRMLTYVLLFIGIYKGTAGIAKKDHHQGLRDFLSIGVIPTSLLAAFRHMFLSGQIIQGGRFFEFEAGGANLGIGIAGLVAFLKNMNNNAMGIIFLIYAIYLLMGAVAWAMFKPKGKMVMWMAKFLSTTAALGYFSYVAFTH